MSDLDLLTDPTVIALWAGVVAYPDDRARRNALIDCLTEQRIEPYLVRSLETDLWPQPYSWARMISAPPHWWFVPFSDARAGSDEARSVLPSRAMTETFIATKNLTFGSTYYNALCAFRQITLMRRLGAVLLTGSIPQDLW